LRIIPWSHIKSWRCLGCGNICCTSSLIPLTPKEWVRIVQKLGYEYTETGLTGFYLKRTAENRCVFQYEFMGKYLCAIQDMKPKACKLWPFKVYKYPKYGFAKEALYQYGEENLYIYVDTKCEGIIYGKPSNHLIRNILPEFVEIALDTREEQVYSTANLPVKPKISGFIYL
jgi:hypothetical protein